jgi:hypothetical protein
MMRADTPPLEIERNNYDPCRPGRKPMRSSGNSSGGAL